jgi:hypothetical protein
MHDIAQRLPGVPIAAIKVAIIILVRGDWVYDCDAGDDDTRWMCVRASAAAAAACRRAALACLRRRVVREVTLCCKVPGRYVQHQQERP